MCLLREKLNKEERRQGASSLRSEAGFSGFVKGVKFTSFLYSLTMEVLKEF